jgi:hypothetical protein
VVVADRGMDMKRENVQGGGGRMVVVVKREEGKGKRG